MGVVPAILFLAFVALTAAQEPPRTPIGCAEYYDTTKFDGAKCEMTESYARALCCDWRNSTYYLVGGLYEDSKLETHHNTAICSWTLSNIDLVDPEKCNIGCPGDDLSFDAEKWGQCGGGCKDCPTAHECAGDTAEKCGLYRSVYACNENETPAPLPTTNPDGGSGSTPVACIEYPDTADFTNASCDMSWEDAKTRCCDKLNGKYFAIGGLWEGSPKETHHNSMVCRHSLTDDIMNYVDDSKCNVGCPGGDSSFDPDRNGLCGGGCKDCPSKHECDGDASAQCGLYRSLYSCDGSPVTSSTTTCPPNGVAATVEGSATVLGQDRKTSSSIALYLFAAIAAVYVL